MKRVFILLASLALLFSVSLANINYDTLSWDDDYEDDADYDSTPNKTYTLNVTLIFEQLTDANETDYNFNGTLIMPIQRWEKPALELRLRSVVFRSKSNFDTTVHLSESAMEGMLHSVNVSFTPDAQTFSTLNESTRDDKSFEAVNDSPYAINLNKIKFHEEIKYYKKVDGVIYTIFDTWNRHFTFTGRDGTIIENEAKVYFQTFESQGSSAVKTGAATTAQVSIVLIVLSLIVVAFQ